MTAYGAVGHLGRGVHRVLFGRLEEQSGRRWTLIALGFGASLVLLVLLAAFTYRLLGLPDPNEQHLLAVLQPPSFAHPFGTDSLGRDVLSRTLAAGRTDLSIASIVTLLSVAIGVPLGALGGYLGGAVDAVMMRMTDTVLAFPPLVFIMVVVAIVGPGTKGLLIAVPLMSWAVYARLTRAEMLVVREQNYVRAARTLGFSTARCLVRHALPNVLRPSIVFSMADMVLNILALATLSYLGLGVQAPTPEWGQIIADGETNLLGAWWISTLPGIAVVAVGIGLSLMADSFADLLGQDVPVVA
jgi:peptide/nickel transport system permease protein